MVETPTPDAPKAPPCVMVIFGGAGDLTQRKLMPSLYHLYRAGLLADNLAVVAVDMQEFSHDAFRAEVTSRVAEHIAGEIDAEAWRWIEERLYYHRGDFTDHDSYQQLVNVLKEVDESQRTNGNYLFYLATPPGFFCEISRHLSLVGLSDQGPGHWRRIVFEKPFGHDLASAKQLNSDLHQWLEESQIYRIDHYLGKETVQNIMVLRFANSFAEPMWNRRYVDHVQITVAESVGVEHRGVYYDRAGALRDMVPNHMLSLLQFIAMEPPASFAASAVREEMNKVMHSVLPLMPEDVLTNAVRGQYGPGQDGNGRPLSGYRESPDVDPNSRTETFIALKLMIDNWRWAGVPFYLRTGKRLPAQYSEIAIRYKRAPVQMFRKTSVDYMRSNTLTLRIQPDEGVEFSFGAKIPGPTVRLGKVRMNFSYSDHFGSPPSIGYETLIYDCMNGDATLFKDAESIEACWSLVEPIQDVWSALPPRDFPNYAAGTWGPKSADALLERDGRRWRSIAGDV